MNKSSDIDYQEILSKGSDFWNNWRKNNPSIFPQINNLQLINMDFRGYDFFKTNFNNTSFYGSNLSYCNFKKCSFVNSDLSCSVFTGAIFMESIVTNCNFIYAIFKETMFLDCLIKGAINIDKCIHKGRSYIDGKTFKISRSLPFSFLNGCGLDDWEFELYKIYDPEMSITDGLTASNRIFDLKKSQTEKFYTCFISYSSEDEEFASKLYMDLSKKNVKCWFAPKSLTHGSDIYDSIDTAIDTYEKLIIILSPSSTNSTWVEDEVKKGFAKERLINDKIIMPILLSPKQDLVLKPWVKKIIDNRNYVILTNWRDDDIYNKTINELLTRSLFKKNKKKPK